MVLGRRRKLWARSVLHLQFDGNAIFTCKNIMQTFLLQLSSPDRHSVGLSAVVPSVIPVSHCCLLGDMQQHGFLQALLGLGAHHCQKSLRHWREAVLCPPYATIPPVTYSPRCRGLCMVRSSVVPISTIFHTPAALALCVWLYYPD